MEGEIEVLSIDVRYYYIGNTTIHDVRNGNGRDMERREGVWASLVRDALYNEELRGNDDTHNNHDVSASRVCMFLKDLDFPSIPDVIAKVDDTTVVVEKIFVMLFMEWLKAPTELMWSQDSTGTQYQFVDSRNTKPCIIERAAIECPFHTIRYLELDFWVWVFRILRTSSHGFNENIRHLKAILAFKTFWIPGKMFHWLEQPD
ncbi:hypothetical protein RHSIM_Rhsim10G0208900 [Rhododendron simsii]|uniref:Uncharacterized protein n=1 Tax=Rhododendron simsii TaxID=118357 RepID=A0A834GAK8_RHOSS|nr:hypothetical protein RHSIM_Rhsim10G0208900 [Rhododendron simsii]